MTSRGRLAATVTVLGLAGALGGVAGASEPVLLGPFQLTLGGEASGSFAASDPEHFNESEYGLSLLRLFRVGLCAEVQAGPHVAAVAEVRSENAATPRVYALYLRVRPWKKRAFDLQAGLVPPVFGAFARQSYGTGSALIGYPLAYHYPTLVRADAAPSGPADLERWRGSGWWLKYPVGDTGYDQGLPLVAALSWDTGVQAHLVTRPWEVSAALTQGTLGHPVLQDDNDGKQVSARVAWRSSFGLDVGASFARGEYASRALREAVPAARGLDLHQRAVGLDVQHAWGHVVLRGEVVWSAWDAVAQEPSLLGETLTATAVSVEGRYRAWPGVTLATRVEHLAFGDVGGPTGRMSWDAPVSRVEAGVGYALLRNLGVKVAYQHNWRDRGRLGAGGFVAVQAVAWF